MQLERQLSYEPGPPLIIPAEAGALGYFFKFIIATNGTADSVVKNQVTREL